MGERDRIEALLARGIGHLRTEPPDAEELREMLEAAPTRAESARRLPGLAAAAAMVLVVAVLALRPFGRGTGGAEPSGDELPLLRVEPGPGWSAEPFRASFRIGADSAELRLGYEPADGGPRVRRRSGWEPIPAPANAGEGEIPAVRIEAPAATPWRRVQVLVGPGPGGGASYYLAGRREDGETAALPLLVDPPAVARRLGATVTPQDLGLPEHPDAFRAVLVERRHGFLGVGVGRVGGMGTSPDRWPIELWSSFSEGAALPGLIRGRPILSGPRSRIARMGRLPPADGGRGFVLLLADSWTRVVDVLRAVELAGGDPKVLFWASRWDRAVESDGRGRADELLRPWRSAPAEVVVSVPVVGDVRVDLPRRKGVTCPSDGIPFPEEEFASLVLQPRAGTPWARCLPAVREARRRGAALAFGFARGRVLPVPALRGGQSPVKVRVVPRAGAPESDPGEADLHGRDIVVTAPPEALAEDVLKLVQFLLWRGVTGVDFR